ncbi:MAG TPA: enoyl-CoA hydratase-related protein [Nevskiaceae bacterium]|nr:enoyl-CoA hydratase-related protein [Nevskiaceae bacterium]
MTAGIDFEVQGGIATITLNRPETNSLTLPLTQTLLEAATTCDEDRAIRAVLLQAHGRMFCAGGDLKDFASQGDRIGAGLKTLAMTLHAAMSRFARMDKPLVCAVQGAAAGAGLSLAVSGDLVVAAKSASFTMAYTAAGLVPDGGSTYLLPRLVGLRRAQELMITNRKLTATEALEWGLVTQVVDDAELATASRALIEKLAAGPTKAFGAVKQLLLEAYGPFETQTEREGRAIAAQARTRDGQEGIRAFLERRKPSFTGE